MCGENSGAAYSRASNSVPVVKQNKRMSQNLPRTNTGCLNACLALTSRPLQMYVDSAGENKECVAQQGHSMRGSMLWASLVTQRNCENMPHKPLKKAEQNMHNTVIQNLFNRIAPLQGPAMGNKRMCTTVCSETQRGCARQKSKRKNLQSAERTIAWGQFPHGMGWNLHEP